MPRQVRTFTHKIPNFKHRLVKEVISTTPLSCHKDEVTEMDTVIFRFMAPENGSLSSFRTYIAGMGEEFARLKVFGTFGGKSWNLDIKVPRGGIDVSEVIELEKGERLTVMLSPKKKLNGTLDVLNDIWLSCTFKVAKGRPARIEEPSEEEVVDPE